MAGGKGGQSMSSREIAELCEKQHAHVMRDFATCLSNFMAKEEHPNLDRPM